MLIEDRFISERVVLTFLRQVSLLSQTMPHFIYTLAASHGRAMGGPSASEAGCADHELTLGIYLFIEIK